jgi:hypothetical protein
MYSRVIIIYFVISTLLISPAVGKRLHGEDVYNKHFCEQLSGSTEFYLLDKSGRVDCITDKYAIEADHADKYTEGITQALYYGMKTDKMPGLLLIVEQAEQYKYVDRASEIIKFYNLPVRVWISKPEDIQ